MSGQQTVERRRWADMDREQRQRVRDDPVLQPSDFQRGDGE